MKSKMLIALALFSFNTYALEFGEENLDGTLFQTVTLHSNELQKRVTNDLFRLMGMAGRTINGERTSLFPLKLIQGFRKPSPELFPLQAKIYFQNKEVSYNIKKGHISLTGRPARFLFDLMENNFFNLKVKRRFSDNYEISYNHISCISKKNTPLVCFLEAPEIELPEIEEQDL